MKHGKKTGEGVRSCGKKGESKVKHEDICRICYFNNMYGYMLPGDIIK